MAYLLEPQKGDMFMCTHGLDGCNSLRWQHKVYNHLASTVTGWVEIGLCNQHYNSV